MEPQFEQKSRRVGRYRGIMLAATALLFYCLAQEWRGALDHGLYHPKASFLFAALLVFFAHEAIFPDTGARQMDRPAKNWSDTPPRYRWLMAASVAAGLANLFLIRSW